MQFKNSENPSVINPIHPLIKKFFERIEKRPNGCWIWIGSLDTKHYGRIKHLGKSTKAHRVAWQIYRGEIPNEMAVCHNCPNGDNPSCVNPSHLFLGTRAENTKDAMIKGSLCHGSKCHKAKLNENDVALIRTMFRTNTATRIELAKRFGVSAVSISYIINGKTWKHVMEQRSTA